MIEIKVRDLRGGSYDASTCVPQARKKKLSTHQAHQNFITPKQENTMTTGMLRGTRVPRGQGAKDFVKTTDLARSFLHR